MRSRVLSGAAPLQAEIDSLKAILADSETRLAKAAAERRQLIPVAEVHTALDRLNLPRQDPAGRPLFLSQRFALLRARMELES